MTVPHRLEAASQAQVRNTLNDMMEKLQPGDYKITCSTPRAAVSLRNRMNKIRSNDRSEVIKGAAEAKLHIDKGQALTNLDQMVFRVVENVVVVSIAPWDNTSIIEDIARENGITLTEPEPYANAQEVPQTLTETQRQREDREYASAKLL